MSEITFRSPLHESKRVFVDGVYRGTVVYMRDQWWALDRSEKTVGCDHTRIAAARLLEPSDDHQDH